MIKRSLNPFVISSATRSPFLSSKALFFLSASPNRQSSIDHILCSHGRSHTDGFHRSDIKRCASRDLLAAGDLQNLSNSFNWSILIFTRIPRQELEYYIVIMSWNTGPAANQSVSCLIPHHLEMNIQITKSTSPVNGNSNGLCRSGRHDGWLGRQRSSA
jgi:hypothetical protein